jgi:alanine-alpha-ketoisovalerate/valine-pyruvate aminotransferase
MPTTANVLYNQLHGKDCEFLNKNAVIEFAERFARSFYAQKLAEAVLVIDSDFEEKRNYPQPPSIQELP